MRPDAMLRRRKRGLAVLKTSVAAISVALSFLSVSHASDAASLVADSSTYAQSREAADGTKILGAYEYLDLDVQNIGNDSISFHSGGWLRYDFKGEEFGHKTNNDLQYAFLSFKSKTDNAIMNLGRVMVFEGVAAERVDGAYARTDLKGGFGVSAFGGSPVETNANYSGNNVIYGGRVSQGMSGVYTIGVSALKEEKESLDYRKEAGVDIWLHPMSNVDITGRSSYNDITRGWMEHTYVLMLGPFADLRFDTTASWINYDDYFFRATTSALSVLGGLIPDDERVRILGEAASYQATDSVRVTADYKNFDYKLQGKANYYGGAVKYSGSGLGFGAGYHRMGGETARLRYDEYRVYASKKLGNLDVTADVINVAYDKAVNRVHNAYGLSLAAQYDLTEAWKLGADVEYSHNPDFQRDTRAMLKVLYHFGSTGGA